MARRGRGSVLVSAPSRPVAPAYSDQALSERARAVLDALRKRRLQFDNGAPGVLGPTLTRDALRALTGRSDREVRAAVQELRCAAHPVVSDSGQAGYWLSTDPEEIRVCAERTYQSRIREQARASRGLLRAASAVSARPETQGTLRGVLG